MTGRDNEQQCMAIVHRGRGRFAPAPTIRACEQAMTGDANALACLASAVHARRDPTPRSRSAVSTARSSSLHPWARGHLPRPPGLTRCHGDNAVPASRATVRGTREQAMTGDANALACLDAVAGTGTRYEPSDLVTFCERETVGDVAALLACARGAELRV